MKPRSKRKQLQQAENLEARIADRSAEKLERLMHELLDAESRNDEAMMRRIVGRIDQYPARESERAYVDVITARKRDFLWLPEGVGEDLQALNWVDSTPHEAVSSALEASLEPVKPPV